MAIYCAGEFETPPTHDPAHAPPGLLAGDASHRERFNCDNGASRLAVNNNYK